MPKLMQTKRPIEIVKFIACFFLSLLNLYMVFLTIEYIACGNSLIGCFGAQTVMSRISQG